MMESVHYFVRGLFRGMNETADIVEQREELENHIEERIADSVSQGMSEREAFTKAIESLGNLNELIETITGEKKKVYIKKLDLTLHLLELAYGSAYMLAVGIWFYLVGFNYYAVYIAIPGWLGFALPAAISWVTYLRNKNKIALVAVNNAEEIRMAIIGWAAITTASWLANLLLMSSETFLSVIWAWMPTLGLLTWPLGTACYGFLIRHSKSPMPSD